MPLYKRRRPAAGGPAPPAYRRIRVGLLGGSFNPAHEGHLHVSRLALRRLGLHQVWWLVSPQNPLKAERGMASLEERVLTARAVARDPAIVVTDIEVQIGTRFSVDTVRALRRRHRRARFVWLIGADNLAQMPRWRHWETLFALVPIAVFARKPYSLKALSGPAAQRFARFRLPERAVRTLAGRNPPAWMFLHVREHPASATAIRKARGTSRGTSETEI